MKNTKNPFVRENLLLWAGEIQDICAQEGDTRAVQEIMLAVERYRSGHFILSVIGMAKTGKSTLINALLGRHDDKLAPTDKMPATNVVTVFKWGEEPKVEVKFKGEPAKIIEVDEIKDYVTEEGNPNNGKNVYMVTVEGPYADLLTHLTIVDLPGLGSIHEAHAQVFYDHLPASDAVLLMTTARMPIKDDERKLLAELKQMDLAKVFVAINKTDVTEPEELAQCEQHNRNQIDLLGISSRKMHKLCAKAALEGNWAKSGLDELMRDLYAFINQEKGGYLAEGLVTSVMGAASTSLQALATRIAATGKSIQEISAERTRLKADRQAAGQLGEINEKEFLRTWDRAISEAEAGIPVVQASLSNRLLAYVEGTNLLMVGSLQRELSKNFNAAVEEEIGGILTPMEETLRQACGKLESEYPRIQLLADHSTRIRGLGKHDGTLAKGVLGGGALVAGGVGLLTVAGASAAAVGTTLTVTSPVLAAIAAWCPAWLGGTLAAIGTSTVAVPAAPSVLLLAAGPVGWTLAGLGALAIPLTWGIARKRKREDIATQVEKQVEAVCTKVKNERLAVIRKFGPKIAEDFRLDFERRVQAIDDALAKVAARAGEVTQDPGEKRRFERLENLLNTPPAANA